MDQRALSLLRPAHFVQLSSAELGFIILSLFALLANASRVGFVGKFLRLHFSHRVRQGSVLVCKQSAPVLFTSSSFLA